VLILLSPVGLVGVFGGEVVGGVDVVEVLGFAHFGVVERGWDIGVFVGCCVVVVGAVMLGFACVDIGGAGWHGSGNLVVYWLV